LGIVIKGHIGLVTFHPCDQTATGAGTPELKVWSSIVQADDCLDVLVFCKKGKRRTIIQHGENGTAATLGVPKYQALRFNLGMCLALVVLVRGVPIEDGGNEEFRLRMAVISPSTAPFARSSNMVRS
jgi:hypothetical protein